MTDQKLQQAYDTISQKWDGDIIPQLQEYIKIPNKSPLFDSDWKANGYMDAAMDLIVKWCEQQPIKDLSYDLLESEGRTPLLILEVPGDIDDTIFIYGHMDKQPEMSGWYDGYGPWQPVLNDGKLYGRGGADDGYAVFCALTSIATLQQNKIPHARCVIMIEASEESGSVDLPFYLDQLKAKIGTPSLIITLDSECSNYQQLWGTTSLRGIVGGDLTIEVLESGLHSGYGSGVVPSTFSILRELLDRVEDANTGKVLVEALNANIPQQHIDQARAAGKIIGADFYNNMGFVGNTQPVTDDVSELMLNRSWRPALSITGIDGLPTLDNAGNVTIPKLAVKVSMRTPPTCNVDDALAKLKTIFESDPPHGANVTFTSGDIGPGWESPQLTDWLIKANDKASHLFFDKPAGYLGMGGSIPFMGMLGEMYPEAQFLITGVLGPHSNAHGPNEFLHIDMVKRLTGCVASVIASHFETFS